MPCDAFISHASVDAELALAICEGLEKRGLTCWIAPRDVRSEGTYGTEILKGLRDSTVFLIVLTGASSESEQVEREAERASHYRKRIIPLSVGGGEPGERLEFYTAGRQRVACAATIDDPFLDRLAQVIRGDRPSAPEPQVATSPRRRLRHSIAGAVAAVVLIATLGLWLSGVVDADDRRRQPMSVPASHLHLSHKPTRRSTGQQSTRGWGYRHGPAILPSSNRTPAPGEARRPLGPSAGNVRETRQRPNWQPCRRSRNPPGGASASPAARAALPLAVNGVTLRFVADPWRDPQDGVPARRRDCSDDEKVKRKSPSIVSDECDRSDAGVLAGRRWARTRATSRRRSSPSRTCPGRMPRSSSRS